MKTEFGAHTQGFQRPFHFRGPRTPTCYSKWSWDHRVNILKGPNAITLRESLKLLYYTTVHVKFSFSFSKRLPGQNL